MQSIVRENNNIKKPCLPAIGVPRQILGNNNLARINLTTPMATFPNIVSTSPMNHHQKIISSDTMKPNNITDQSYSNCLLLGKENPSNNSVHSSSSVLRSLESSRLSWGCGQNIFPVTMLTASMPQQSHNYQQKQPQQIQLPSNQTNEMVAHVNKTSNDDSTKYSGHTENNSSNLLFNFKSSFSFNQQHQQQQYQVNHQDMQKQQPVTINSNTPIENNSNTNDMGGSMSDYDDKDVPIISIDAGAKNPDPFIEITQLAMRGCEVAEPIAQRYSNRPCFKKIDCLCARLKQDLVRPDGVLANINSQGIAWAIKDLIFVFTRIINAWIIVKGYVNQPPNRIRPALTSDFNEMFFEWQNSTKKFVEKIIKSFMNLDQIEKMSNIPSQKLQKSSTDSRWINEKHCWSAAAATTTTTTTTTTELADGQIYGSSDHSQLTTNQILNFKSVELTSPPLKQTSQLSPSVLLTNITAVAPSQSELIHSDNNSVSYDGSGNFYDGGSGDQMQNDLFNNFSPNSSSSPQNGCNYLSNLLEDSEEIQRKAIKYETYIKTGLYTPLKCERNQNYGGEIVNSFHSSNEIKQKINNLNTNSVKPVINVQPQQYNHNFHQIQQECYLQNSKILTSSSKSSIFSEQKSKENDSLFSTIEFNNLNEMLRQQEMEKFKLKEKYLLNKIQNLNEAKFFFIDQFTKNYFPDFLSIVPNYIDIRKIVLKHECGGYDNIFAIVYDLQQIIFSAKLYLQKQPHLFLNNSILAFEKGFHDILHEQIFADFDFSHIITNDG